MKNHCSRTEGNPKFLCSTNEYFMHAHSNFLSSYLLLFYFHVKLESFLYPGTRKRNVKVRTSLVCRVVTFWNSFHRPMRQIFCAVSHRIKLYTYKYSYKDRIPDAMIRAPFLYQTSETTLEITSFALGDKQKSYPNSEEYSWYATTVSPKGHTSDLAQQYWVTSLLTDEDIPVKED